MDSPLIPASLIPPPLGLFVGLRSRTLAVGFFLWARFDFVGIVWFHLLVFKKIEEY
jgi:hypothetical protein